MTPYSENPKPNEVLLPTQSDINPLINASSLTCTPDMLVIYVYTAPGNFEKRQLIRRTFGSVSMPVSVKVNSTSYCIQ